MKTKKHTPVEWLFDEIQGQLKEPMSQKFIDLFNHALEIEQDHIVEAWEDGYDRDFAQSGENFYVDKYGYMTELTSQSTPQVTP